MDIPGQKGSIREWWWVFEYVKEKSEDDQCELEETTEHFVSLL